MTYKFPPLPEHAVEEWSESGITLRYVGWSEEKVKAYAETVRNQALEDAITICKKEWLSEVSDYPYDRGWSNSAKRIVENLQEILK